MHNGIHSQSRSGLPLDNDQSHASDGAAVGQPIGGGWQRKTTYRQKYDADYIDEFIDPNLSDDLYNIHDVDAKTLEKTTLEADKENMLQKVEDGDYNQVRERSLQIH